MRDLHPHQERALKELREAVGRGSKRPLLQAPTGSGKTVLAAAIIESARRKGNRVVFTVPSIPLVDQTAREFFREGIRDIGVMQADHRMTDPSRPVQIASIQTLSRRPVPEAQLVIVDEAHKNFSFIGDWMMRDEWIDVPFIGLSATPWTKGLGRLYDRLIVAATTRELIDKGLLSDFRVFAPSKPDLSGVRTVADDYHQEDLRNAMNKAHLTADIVETWLSKGRGLPTLCFGVDRIHAKTLQIQFERAGVTCGYIDANTTDLEREEVRKRFSTGEYEVVCNVGVLTTGVDWDVRCIVLARPTKSEILYTQILGRGLRTAPGKSELLILDHTESTLRLGFVTDIHHTHLDGGVEDEAKKAASKPKPIECTRCHYVRVARLMSCPACGFVPDVITHVVTQQGELVDLTTARKANRLDEWPEKVAFIRQLRAYQIQTGKQAGWVGHKYRARYGVWPNDPRVKYAPPAAGVSAEVRAWITSQNIRFVRSRKAEDAA